MCDIQYFSMLKNIKQSMYQYFVLVNTLLISYFPFRIYSKFRGHIIEMKNHENHHCKTLYKALVNDCSFEKEKLVEIFIIDDNSSVEDSNFKLEEVKGKPKLKKVKGPSGFQELWDKCEFAK